MVRLLSTCLLTLTLFLASTITAAPIEESTSDSNADAIASLPAQEDHATTAGCRCNPCKWNAVQLAYCDSCGSRTGWE